MLSAELAVIADCTNKRQARRVRDTGSSAALVARWRADGTAREKWVRGVDEQRHGSPWHVTQMRGRVYCHDYLCSTPQLKAHIELADKYDVVHDRSAQPEYVRSPKL